MALESLAGLGFGVAFLVGLAIYADRHRAEANKNGKRKGKHRHT